MGHWRIVGGCAGDFIQTLVLMPISWSGVSGLAQVGGWRSFLDKLRNHHLHWTEGARPEILYCGSSPSSSNNSPHNNMMEASRYLTAKDGRSPERRSWLDSVLWADLLVHSPMAARIAHPDSTRFFRTEESARAVRRGWVDNMRPACSAC